MHRILTALAFAVAVLSATDVAGAPVLSAGLNPEFSGDAAVRYRSFGNTGGNETYLGKGDLGQPGNRVEQGYTWTDGAFDFAFTIDLANNRLTSKLPGASLLTYGYTADPIINAFKISSIDRAAQGELWITNLIVNGTSLGAVTSAASEGVLDFTVTGVAVSTLYTITGKIHRTGFFGSSQEGSRIDIVAGYVPPPAIPLPAAAWMLLAGLAGLAAVARRGKDA
ncbi:VPLPA-CTERM sorting domain-containing protein [Palleronia sp. KMU-117]|uniref:VPLPA-CTERM sorting domain-containing protein n=1 Tax=Palleronia sp. KMU-117 TaxID=3434108 RepID=UPI003D73A8B7